MKKKPPLSAKLLLRQLYRIGFIKLFFNLLFSSISVTLFIVLFAK